MDYDEDSSRGGHDSNFVGAIFMCNRTTKKECLKRKLFGLPMSKAGFVNKVKTGMFLFLFEYERRELYGVFEATTDGAINIAPEAYAKSGSSFPAQVHFESLWICHPLSEDEFRDAIRENYFAPYKFNFGLSYVQVAKLVELFSSKKKSPRNRDSLDNDNNVTVDTTEQCDMNHMYSKCRLGGHHSMFNENPMLALEDPNPNLTYSTSPVNHSVEQSYFAGSKSPFRVLGASKPNFAQTLTDPYPYPSYPDPETYNFSSTKYHEHNSFNELGVDVPNSTQRFSGTLGSHSYPSQQVPATFNLPSSLHDDYLPLQPERYLNFNYDSSTFKEVDSARGMRYWKLLPSNPNLPLVEDDLSSWVPGRYSPEPRDADAYGTEEGRYFSKGSSTSASSKLQSEMLTRRTSVFSRLSKAPKRVSSGDDADGSSSSDLLKLLSRRRSQWSKMPKASRRPFPHLNGDKRLENADSTEPVDAELASESAGADEESVEIPFINFKRRSGDKNADDKTEGTFKRRKLIRPSFTENDPKDGKNKDTSALEAENGRNPKRVSQASAVVGAGTDEHGVFKSDFEYEGDKSRMLLDLNSEATYLESNPNISKLDSDTRKEEQVQVPSLISN